MKTITIGGYFDPIKTYEKLQEHSLGGEYSFIYENNNVSVVGSIPTYTIKLQNDKWHLKRYDITIEEMPSESPYSEFRHILKKLGNELKLFGYISFDLSKYYYDYTKTNTLPLIEFIQPGVQMLFYTNYCQIISDNPEYYADYLVDSSREKQEIVKVVECDINDEEGKDDFIRKIYSCQNLIEKNILKKIIISRIRHFEIQLKPIELYFYYKQFNNSLTNFLLEYSNIKIIGCSPEILLSSDSKQVFTNVLAGTKQRSSNPIRDLHLRNELLTNEKEIFEHAISVMAAYREMKMFCVPEKVNVKRFMEIKEYKSVRHIFSQISGIYQKGKDIFDALQILFPAITVSGVPKDIAIKYINKIEDTPRDLYAGVVGYFNSEGQGEFPIAIRCIFSESPNNYYIRSGAGIVGASNPLDEFNETKYKMAAMIRAITSREQRQCTNLNLKKK
ncbi:MAG: chorismate-binding protein [bacterium]